MPIGNSIDNQTATYQIIEQYRRERERGSVIQIEMRHDHSANAKIVTVHFGPLAAQTELDRSDIDNLSFDEQAHQVARDLSGKFARMLHDQILREIGVAEHEYQQRLQRERMALYGRSPAMDMVDSMRHARDVMRGVMDVHVTKAIPLKTWFKHKKFELNGWTAALLETDEQINAEGELMQHCFARSYRNRIAKEEYLGYHITPPEGRGLPKSGFTLGFEVKKRGKHFSYDQVKGKKNDTHHCNNSELLAMIEHIDRNINNKPQRQKPDHVEIVNRALGLIGA